MIKNKNQYRRGGDAIPARLPERAKIKVRLDSRTVITIQDISALQVWLVRYPDAKVMDH
jgi:hypothetical protein